MNLQNIIKIVRDEILWSLTSAVLDALIPIFFSGWPLEGSAHSDYEILTTQTHLVTPEKARSTMNAVTLSLISPVFGSLTGVCANTVNTSAIPPLLILGVWERTEDKRESGEKIPYFSSIQDVVFSVITQDSTRANGLVSERKTVFITCQLLINNSIH